MKMDIRKRNTCILLIVILFLAGVLFLAQKFVVGQTGNYVVVTVKGRKAGEYMLAKDQKISINGGTNILEIKAGYAKMMDADCPDHLCIKQGKISHVGESIVCLPNKIVVTVESKNKNKQDGYDSIAK